MVWITGWSAVAAHSGKIDPNRSAMLQAESAPRVHLFLPLARLLPLRFQRPVSSECLRVPTKNSVLTSPRNIVIAPRVNECARLRKVDLWSIERVEKCCGETLVIHIHIYMSPHVLHARARTRTPTQNICARCNATRVSWISYCNSNCVTRGISW